MSFGQTEQMTDRLPRVNDASVPLNLYEVWSLPGVFLFHCLFVQKLQMSWYDSAASVWLSAQSDMQSRPVYSFQQDIPVCFPLTAGRASSAHFWSPSSQSLCPRGFPLKHRQRGSNAQMAGTDGNVKMKHKSRSWKETVPNTWSLKETLVHKAFVVPDPKLAYSVKQELLLSAQEDKLMLILFPSAEHYFLGGCFCFPACVEADFSLTFRILTTAIKPLQIHVSSCPPLSPEPLIFTLCLSPWADI